MITRDKLEQRIAALEMAEKQRRDSMATAAAVEDFIAPVYKPLHEDIRAGNHRFYNLPGGRGSCKSSFVSLEIVDGIQKDATGQSNAIVFRRVSNTMRDSVFSQIAWAIDMMGVSHLWKATVSPMQYEYIPTGAQILFRGLDDAGKLKSIKPRHGLFRYVWFEEFSELPGANFARNVLQSVMRGQGANPIVFRSFNPPISKNNWANMFIKEPDAQAMTLLTNYTMIPPEWLGDGFLYEAERLKALNEQAYQHEYMGVPTGTGGEVSPNLEIREITDEEMGQMGYIYQGLDFGFAVDPAAFTRVAYDRKYDTVYFLDEIYARGMSNAKMAEAIKAKGYDNGYVICDSAEPKSIADLRTNGIHAQACYKAPGCVEYRCKWLQHRRIVIDPKRTPNAYREFVNYSYPVDKDGQFLSRLEDKDNHTIDSAAYALTQLIFTNRVSA